jgi:hypothetical protein
MATLDDQLKSEAYLIYSEFGSGLRTPRAQRLAAEFPQVPDAMRDQWITEFKQVDSAVWKIAIEDTLSSSDTSSELEKKFAGLFSWMSGKALQRAHFLTSYYAWHEGYTKV